MFAVPSTFTARMRAAEAGGMAAAACTIAFTPSP
jgi:hypothetical protein